MATDIVPNRQPSRVTGKIPLDNDRHYTKGFILRLNTRQRRFLEAVKARTGKEISAFIRDLIDKANAEAERTGQPLS